MIFLFFYWADSLWETWSTNHRKSIYFRWSWKTRKADKFVCQKKLNEQSFHQWFACFSAFQYLIFLLVNIKLERNWSQACEDLAGLQLTIIFINQLAMVLIYWIIVQSVKCQKIVINGHYSVHVKKSSSEKTYLTLHSCRPPCRWKFNHLHGLQPLGQFDKLHVMSLIHCAGLSSISFKVIL